MLKEDTRRALLLYTKRAEALRQTTFAKQIEEQGKVTLHLRFHRDEGPSGEHSGPDLEAITVAAARVRQFIQKSEPISFPKMAQVLGDPDVSSHWKEQFREVREAVNAALDDALPYVENGQTLTRRRLLDVFLNGELFHSEEGKVEVFERWQAVPLFYPLVEFELVNTIAFLMNAILFLSHLCQLELAGGGQASGSTERE